MPLLSPNPPLRPVLRTPRVAVALALLFTAGLTACGDDPAGPGSEAESAIEFVEAFPETRTLADALARAGLDDVLHTGGPYTLFAPTDLAFADLGDGTLQALLADGNRALLREVLRRHVVPGRFTLDDLTDGRELQPLEGPPLRVEVLAGRAFVGGAEIEDAGPGTGQDVVHLIDDVVRDHLSIAERVRLSSLLSTFEGALEDGNLLATLDGAGPYTVFAPINAGFDRLGTDVAASLLGSGQRDLLRRVLRYHVVEGRYAADDLLEGADLETLEGSTLAVEQEAGTLYAGGSRVIVASVETGNGVLHLLADVLLNPLTIADRLRIEPDLEQYRDALAAAGLLDDLAGEGPFTLLAADNRGFNKLGAAVIPALLERPALLNRVLQYNLLPGRYEADAFE
ncbi:MAG: fasciclin domain-containing protein, partial [Rhodothermales bacterium]|nr:fasciclin domain-containing protein [Rhodothermales bacterium]